MPTYEYKCEKCGNVFEEFQSITDDSITKCPKCGGKVHRLIGAGAGLIFKGSGFYLTDYKRSNSSPTTSNSESKPSQRTDPSNKSEKTRKQKVDKMAAPKIEKEAK
ncbi:MAG: FmdB family zinc ribbon protein [Candidatus Kryptoniota bacterium]